MKHPVLLAIDVSDVNRMIPSGSISSWTLKTWASEVKIARREGLKLDLGILLGPWGPTEVLV